MCGLRVHIVEWVGMTLLRKCGMLVRAVRTIRNWPTFLSEYVGITRGELCTIRLRGGTFFLLRAGTNDKVLFGQVWLARVYEPKGFEIKDSDTVIDIGAHIGFFTVRAARKANRGRVYSFEPAPQNFEMLQKNVSHNGLKNVTLINGAMSDRKEEKEFILYPESTGAHSFLYGPTDQKNIIRVRTESLDGFFKTHALRSVDFLKMDCEGAEYEILFNTTSKILQNVKKIAMEYHNRDDEHNVGALKRFLERQGFSVTVNRSGDNMLYALRP